MYRIIKQSRGRILIKEVEVWDYENPEQTEPMLVDVVLRPISWDDKTILADTVGSKNKIKMAQAYARIIEHWTSEDPITATNLASDKYFHLCQVVDACMVKFFLKPIEFSVSE